MRWDVRFLVAHERGGCAVPPHATVKNLAVVSREREKRGPQGKKPEPRGSQDALGWSSG